MIIDAEGDEVSRERAMELDRIFQKIYSEDMAHYVRLFESSPTIREAWLKATSGEYLNIIDPAWEEKARKEYERQ